MVWTSEGRKAWATNKVFQTVQEQCPILERITPSGHCYSADLLHTQQSCETLKEKETESMSCPPCTFFTIFNIFIARHLTLLHEKN